MLPIIIIWIFGNAHILGSNQMGKIKHIGTMCNLTDISQMYFKEVVYKELDDLIWLRVASHCGHKNESTDNV